VRRSRTAASPRSRCSVAEYSAVLDAPRVVVPLGGMIVSGAMLAAGLTLRRLREDAEQARPTIEARLCLGLSAHEAFLPHQ
jgi:ABC-type iron transport system FetAB permease component